MKKKKQVPGRPFGSINKKNDVARDCIGRGFRCSEGFNKITDMLIEEGYYKSRADVYHEALQLLAMKKDIKDPGYQYWISRLQ